MKYLITLFAAMCMATLVNAQSHTFKQCHLNPKWENAKKDVENSGPSCVACVKNDEKERLAKIAEKKQRDDMHNAKVAAELAAKKKAYAEEQKKKEASRHSGEVLINNNQDKVVKTPVKKNDGKTLAVAKANNTKSKLFGRQETENNQTWTIISNEKGEVLLKSTEFTALNWDVRNSDLYLKRRADMDTPRNVIIVRLNTGFGSLDEYNLIDSKGKKVLGEQNIRCIVYCGNGFFMYFTHQEDFFTNSYRIGGESMILYDYTLNKKYVYNKVADDASCSINNRVQIDREAKLDCSQCLFSFQFVKCTHQQTSRGWTANEENIGVGTNRKPYLIGTTEGHYGGDH